MSPECGRARDAGDAADAASRKRKMFPSHRFITSDVELIRPRTGECGQDLSIRWIHTGAPNSAKVERKRDRCQIPEQTCKGKRSQSSSADRCRPGCSRDVQRTSDHLGQHSAVETLSSNVQKYETTNCQRTDVQEDVNAQAMKSMKVQALKILQQSSCDNLSREPRSSHDSGQRSNRSSMQANRVIMKSFVQFGHPG